MYVALDARQKVVEEAAERIGHEMRLLGFTHKDTLVLCAIFEATEKEGFKESDARLGSLRLVTNLMLTELFDILADLKIRGYVLRVQSDDLEMLTHYELTPSMNELLRQKLM